MASVSLRVADKGSIHPSWREAIHQAWIDHCGEYELASRQGLFRFGVACHAAGI